MALIPIPFKKGAFKLPHDRALSNNDYAQRLVNLLIDDNGDNYDRPCLSTFATCSSSEILGFDYFKNLVVFVTYDRKIWTMNSSAEITDITGDIAAGTGRPVFAKDDEAIYIICGEKPIKWTGTGTTSVITNAPRGTHIAFLDQFLIINDKDEAAGNTTFRWSNAGDANEWDAEDFASAEGGPDPIVAEIVNQREIYLIGSRTTEVWTNVGDLTAPFQRVFFYEYGTQAPYSPVVADNSVCFLDHNRKFIRYTGRTPQYIGKPVTDEISTYENIGDCVGWTAEYRGKTFIFWAFPREGKCWCYDLSTDNWSEVHHFTNGQFSRWKANCVLTVPEWNMTFAGAFDSGKIYKLTDSVKTEDGAVFKRTRMFSKFDGGNGSRKKCNRLRLQIKRGVAVASSGTENDTNPQIELRWRNENGVWSEYQRKSLGEIGDHTEYVDFFRLGNFRSQQLELSFTENAEFRLMGVEEDLEGMTK